MGLEICQVKSCMQQMLTSWPIQSNQDVKAEKMSSVTESILALFGAGKWQTCICHQDRYIWHAEVTTVQLKLAFVTHYHLKAQDCHQPSFAEAKPHRQGATDGLLASINDRVQQGFAGCAALQHSE